MNLQIGPGLFRWMINLWPCFRGSGGRVTYIARDWRELRIELPLGWRTRNYVGTIFGGSIYGVVDPFYMIMLMKVLGPGFTVWDKSAEIRFRKPGRSRLFAQFHLEDAELEEIRRLLGTQPKVDRTYTVTLADAAGVAHAEITKVVQIRRKEARP